VSALLYGRMVQRQRTEPRLRELETTNPPVAEENKLATTIAALFPAEVLTAHAFIISKTTTTDADGNTTITNLPLLHDALPLLLAATIILYVIGRGLAKWSGSDVVRVFIPPVAFLVWAGIIGTTTALTPWITAWTAPQGPMPKDYFVLLGAVAALILIGVSAKVNPPQAAA
jgi:hypothetical protein